MGFLAPAARCARWQNRLPAGGVLGCFVDTRTDSDEMDRAALSYDPPLERVAAGSMQQSDWKAQAAFLPHSRFEAMSAPARNVASLDHTTSSVTHSQPTKVPKPQSRA
jgi:hypothetical protein